MALTLLEVTNASYKTTRVADQQCTELLGRLGFKVRYLPARLAIARSLALPSSPPSLSEDDEEETAASIRGQQLFGDGSDPATWLALITQRSGETDLSRKQFQSLVAAHWKRGAELLTRDWEEAGGEFASFIAGLAERASLGGNEGSGDLGRFPTGTFAADAITLPIGEVALDVQSQERVFFPLNAAGGSPHMAIMGGAGSGKTRTAVFMLKKLREQADVPILAFDFKGDLADNLSASIGAEVLHPPRIPIPLNVLHTQQTDETSLREAAGRIRESIARVKTTKLGGIQSEALREAVLSVLRMASRGKAMGMGSVVGIGDVADALEAEYQQRQRKPDELTATLNELTQFQLFEPTMSPSEFFGRSWIIRLPQDGTAETKRLVINLTLDALDRWLNAQPDAPMVEGRRALRHICMLDEAHVILSTRLPALASLARMSRSKGGVLMLVSQSPDDFEGDDEGYLDNMGLTLGFNTQAKPGATRAIFGQGASLVDLPVGQALSRVRVDAKTRRIIAWE
jgi:hypothetical protein